MNIAPPTSRELMKTPLPVDTPKEKKLLQASKDFEAIFVRQILASMHTNTTKNTVFGNSGQGQEIYQSIYDSKLADQIAQGQGLGVGKVLYRQISQQNHLTPTK